MDVYQAISEPTRRDILELLAQKGEMAASDISNKFTVSAPAISQHLKVLLEVNLVSMEKQAQKHIFKINTKPLHNVEDWTRKINMLWAKRLNRLDELLAK